MTIEQELQRFGIVSESLEKTQNAVCIIDKSSKFSFCNKVMSGLIGLPCAEVIGCDQDEVIQRAHEQGSGVNFEGKSINDFLEFIRHNQRTQLEHEFVLSTLENKYYKLARITVSTGEHVVFGTDITELVHTQQQLERTLQQLDQLANTCDLSGIPNRRHIMDCLNKEFCRAKRYGSTFAVVIADIDHFKKVNDTYGHSVGDQAIIHFAELISENLRDSDMIGRVGGEEFAILLPNTNLQQAKIYADRVREKVANTPLVLGSKERLTLTSSFGIAEFSAVDKDVSDLFNRADKALYKAKEAGRNQVCS